MSDDETKKDETTDEARPRARRHAGPVVERRLVLASCGRVARPAPPAADASESEAPAADEGSSDDASAAEEAAAPAAEGALWPLRRRPPSLIRTTFPGRSGAGCSVRAVRTSRSRPSTPEERAAQRREERKLKASQRRTERAAEKAKKGETGTGTPPAEREANAAKVRQGIVVSNKGDKSITVRIDIARRHPTYEKIVRRSRTLHAHDERNEAGEGDVVRVVETRPLSKTKRWRLVDVVEKAR